MRSGPPAEGRRVVGGEGRAGGLNDPERPPRPDVDGWEWVDDAVQGPPSPLLRSIEQTGAFRPQAPSKYGFIQSGTTQARQAAPISSMGGQRHGSAAESRALSTIHQRNMIRSWIDGGIWTFWVGGQGGHSRGKKQRSGNFLNRS